MPFSLETGLALGGAAEERTRSRELGIRERTAKIAEDRLAFDGERPDDDR